MQVLNDFLSAICPQTQKLTEWSWSCAHARDRVLDHSRASIELNPLGTFDLNPINFKKLRPPKPLIEVLFLCTITSNSEEKKSEFHQLFEKMAKALLLQPKDYRILIVDQFDPDQIISEYSCRKILSFGASATHTLLGHDPQTGPRMMNIHGTLFTKNEIQIIPLFHPEFILMNREMKMATWMDLKKYFNVV